MDREFSPLEPETLFYRPATGDDLTVIAEIESKMEVLKLRLPNLEGKANKKERTAVNKEIYALENDDAYVAAKKAEWKAEQPALKWTRTRSFFALFRELVSSLFAEETSK